MPTVAIVAVALPVIVWQQNKNEYLKNELAVSQSKVKSYWAGSRGADSRLGGKAYGQRASKNKAAGVFSAIELQTILEDSDPVSRLKNILEYADGLPSDEIPDVLAALRQSMGKGKELEVISHVLLTRWAQSDPDAAYACLSDFSYKKKGWSSSSLLASLTAMDPRRASDWITDPNNDLSRYGRSAGRMSEVVAGEWVRQDPDAAFAWAQSLPDAYQADTVAEVLSYIAGSDPEQATSMAMAMEPGKVRSEVIGDLAESWAGTSPTEAVAWAESLEGTERAGAMRETIDEWAKGDPSSVAEYLDQLAARESIDPYLRSVASRWSRQEPSKAAEWVVGQSEGAGTRDAMGYVMWNWTRQDPEAAGEWLIDQPSGPTRDAGIAGLSKASGSFDPAAATMWASSISDEQRRGEMLDYSLQQWQQQNPKAARQWAEQNGVAIPGGK